MQEKMCIRDSLRNAADLTQEQVVAQLQLRNLSTTRSAYSQMESGTYNIRISELIALVDIFDTDFNTVFKGLHYEEWPWMNKYIRHPGLFYYNTERVLGIIPNRWIL